ncbi:peptidoglycan DD-metalloendopeptidase family protein [Bermanella marisrubri]|uniref:Membrane protein n=1 Tax=Bermanella marisrubri TaxID=207949 RepID=Q1MXQ3_9GAMM|nr:peptidoglycan DD-metalloendopeptidase family protein [Bermanella marisrubri]EAT10764.1 Membrane protein [Oceanobacter sp. RED65] [Bermanella marisrubri]QIZ83091.1 peptidoglycan DD-metalloendopeptidase family protein [Bermanella marisrubri]
MYKDSALEILPKRHWIALGLTCLFLAALLIFIPVQQELQRRTFAYQVPLPEKTQSKPDQPEIIWDMHEIRPGENLAQLFKNRDLSPKSLYLLTQTEHGSALDRLHPGDAIGFQIENDELIAFRLEKSLYESFEFHLVDSKFNSKKIVLEPDTIESFAQGTINTSLFETGMDAGLSNSVIMQLASIFGWDVDFALDIREGDNFSLIYEEKYLDGKKVGDGDILVARFENQGRSYTAVRYADDSGYSQYYTPSGLSMRKAFLRTPVDFTRISSRFNLNRRHPILHKIRAHRGVDYAARTGTPIKAAGDGKVIFAGRKGGYGKVLILQHGSSYTTLYAHLNAFHRTIRRGKKVKQGQIVAYVGSSGLASGPHLHYEFRVNGVHRNPLTVKLPHARPIDESRKKDFMHYAQVMVMRLESHLYGDYFASR